ncbi:hypothetical protein AWRI1631_143240 [Saccharomyces cerevisiae AWRI1631]|uniref:Uncharacterized protein n=1 Tax=Saccharomyces cerevisiae (strain AWRI1631) TaxID=545124 RepID=B5VR44_YEAS6|nr:hypothetical protein AWRI1631_143240 [Saccharomyces cerevisiae AWRI1631]
MIIAATVWETKVAITRITRPKINTIMKIGSCSTCALINCAIVDNKPDELTALPRVVPPMAKTTIVHMKLLKSSEVRRPVPKKTTIGIIDMIPISPKIPEIWFERHQRTIVIMQTKVTNHCFRVNGSRDGCNCKIFTFGSGGKVMINSTQIAMTQIKHTGSAIINHSAQDGERVHYTNRKNVLRRSDGRRHTTDIGGKSDTKN